MKSQINKTLITAIVSTKGGTCKTTTTINIGSFLAESGLKVLLVDVDVRQPTLSSYYTLEKEAPCGIYEMLAVNNISPGEIISKTCFPGLDLIKSNDSYGILQNLLLTIPDGYIRLRTLLRKIKGYDIILLDTIGTRNIISDMAVIASDRIISPVIPEFLSAREFIRGTLNIFNSLQAYEQNNIPLPSLNIIINRLDRTRDAKEIIRNLYEIIDEMTQNKASTVPLTICKTTIPARVIYRRAATESKPVYHLDCKELERIYQLCSELFPDWQQLFSATYQLLLSEHYSKKQNKCSF